MPRKSWKPRHVIIIWTWLYSLGTHSYWSFAAPILLLLKLIKDGTYAASRRFTFWVLISLCREMFVQMCNVHSIDDDAFVVTASTTTMTTAHFMLCSCAPFAKQNEKSHFKTNAAHNVYFRSSSSHNHFFPSHSQSIPRASCASSGDRCWCTTTKSSDSKQKSSTTKFKKRSTRTHTKRLLLNEIIILCSHIDFAWNCSYSIFQVHKQNDEWNKFSFLLSRSTGKSKAPRKKWKKKKWKRVAFVCVMNSQVDGKLNAKQLYLHIREWKTTNRIRTSSTGYRAIARTRTTVVGIFVCDTIRIIIIFCMHLMKKKGKKEKKRGCLWRLQIDLWNIYSDLRKVWFDFSLPNVFVLPFFSIPIYLYDQDKIMRFFNSLNPLPSLPSLILVSIGSHM